jgi:hypothetical protein
MTDRYNYLTVALETDIRSDDAEALIAAIRMLRGVLKVEPNVTDPNDWLVISFLRALDHCRDTGEARQVTQLPPGTAHGLKPETVGDLIYRQHGGGGPSNKRKS